MRIHPDINVNIYFIFLFSHFNKLALWSAAEDRGLCESYEAADDQERWGSSFHPNHCLIFWHVTSLLLLDAKII